MRPFIQLLISIAFTSNLFCQNMTNDTQKKFAIAFYNVENFFDTLVDSSLKYDSYNPGGEMRWNMSRFQNKSKMIFKVIAAMSGWENIVILGLAEIESDVVLEHLLTKTPLSRDNLKYIHVDSPDIRGMDVALIYDSLKLEINAVKQIPVLDKFDSSFTTRDILYVKGLLSEKEIHIFIVHWTSRYRGVLKSEQLRMLCSETLKHSVDSILISSNNANILIMGDFNDEWDNPSLRNLYTDKQITLLPLKAMFGNADGTLKYGNRWYNFDNILVSNPMLVGCNGLKADSLAIVFDPTFLLEVDYKHNGYKPRRNYIGFKYNNGFSDHLPILLNIYDCGKAD